MSKKRGLGAKRGLDTLLNSSKVGRQVVGVIDDAKAIMPKPSDGSVMAHDQLPADDPAITDTPSNDQISTKIAPQMQAPAKHTADQQSAAHHIEPSVLDHQADALEDAPQLAMHACDDGTVSDEGIDKGASDEGVSGQVLGEQALDALSLIESMDDSPNQTAASIVSEADDAELTDALSELAEYQQREILLFWQYGLSMRDDG
ncbi:hypothetical protein [Moraxella sp. RCAD0137]|uniref:hypothetical protein n=1 Tax=Moraxella sp. RCAD0137 TaxID=1775913 RepID=UPI000C9EF267|nr:hypothetical protein [Moraxella sp. RCAD0137]PNP97541.1 hypothetical protein AZ602_06670 [Moraxella sp. RCAD0137]